jgi:hypothetical protein
MLARLSILRVIDVMNGIGKPSMLNCEKRKRNNHEPSVEPSGISFCLHRPSFNAQTRISGPSFWEISSNSYILSLCSLGLSLSMQCISMIFFLGQSRDKGQTGGTSIQRCRNCSGSMICRAVRLNFGPKSFSHTYTSNPGSSNEAWNLH